MPDFDCILIQLGRAHEIWRDTRKADLPPLHPDLLALIVEQPAGAVSDGDLWDAEAGTFTAEPPPE